MIQKWLRQFKWAINDANDLLYANGEMMWFEGKRIDNPNTHGTGCTLSSAIASNLAKGFTLAESVQRAKDYISGALAAMLDLGKGSGPMNHAFDLQGRWTVSRWWLCNSDPTLGNVSILLYPDALGKKGYIIDDYSKEVANGSKSIVLSTLTDINCDAGSEIHLRAGIFYHIFFVWSIIQELPSNPLWGLWSVQC